MTRIPDDSRGVTQADRLLPDLMPGICATIHAIDADDEDQQRLKAMGVCLGRRVELVKAGDPLILRVLGTRIGVSARLANRVHVTPATSGSVMPADCCLPSHRA